MIHKITHIFISLLILSSIVSAQSGICVTDSIFTISVNSFIDELLNTSMGVCRASGVLKKYEDSWEIMHYHLSVAIPNENMKDVKSVIDKR